jgi:hypothetical protein
LQQRNSSGPSRLSAALELLSIIGPILCLVDCIVIPILLMLLPLVGIHQIYHGVGDQVLLLLVLAICTPTITLGFLKHKRKSVFVLMTLGFSSMFFANFAGHIIDDSLHFILTTLGSILLIKANFDNRQFSKNRCCAHAHAHVTVTEDE